MRFSALIRAVIAILTVLFTVTVMVAFSDTYFTFLCIAAVAVHEAGHVFLILILCGRLTLPRAVGSGMRIKPPRTLSYKEEALTALAGPLFNLIFFVLFLPLFPLFSYVNLATAISNLLPLPAFDGQKIINSLLSLTAGIEKSERISSALTQIFASLLVFVSLYLILKNNGGYWLFFLFFYILAREIYFFQKETKNEYK